MAKAEAARTPTLEEVRARIDAIDGEMLRLVDERASLAHAVAAAKAAQGEAGKFGLKPARENALLRRLLAQPRKGASALLIVRIWREMIGQSLAIQGPFHVAVWGGKAPVRVHEAAKLRFGSSPSMRTTAKPEEALAAARTLGGVAVCALEPENPWWVRLLGEPKLKVFAALPCLMSVGPPNALAVGEVEVEPTGHDQTYWVTDAKGSGAVIEDALSRDGVAATLLLQAGDFKLFMLAGYYQPQDERLARAATALSAKLSGVIGAAPEPLDV